MALPIHRTASARFWPKVKVGSPWECWPWQASKTVRGYGALGQDGNFERMAHRICWTITNSRPIPEGMLVMHTCDNPSCVNPIHLKIGTPNDNMADMVNKGRSGLFGSCAINAAKTHCKNGHELTGYNLMPVKKGRHCRTCHNINQMRRYYELKKASN